MIVIIEGIVLCGLFTLLIIPPLYKNPVGQITSYPPEIRKRVEELPEYKKDIKTKEKRQIMKKICGLFLFVIVFTLISYFSGARSFTSALVHTFILFFVVNVYDLLILDLLLFCNSKKVIIKGTEDMIKAYKSPRHHIRGALLGTFFGALVAVMSGGLIFLTGKW
jgi:hypothetical protein